MSDARKKTAANDEEWVAYWRDRLPGVLQLAKKLATEFSVSKTDILLAMQAKLLDDLLCRDLPELEDWEEDDAERRH